MKSKLNRLASEIKFQFLNLTANCLPVEALTEVGKLLVRRSFSGGEQTANLLILILKISRVNNILSACFPSNIVMDGKFYASTRMIPYLRQSIIVGSGNQ